MDAVASGQWVTASPGKFAILQGLFPGLGECAQ